MLSIAIQKESALNTYTKRNLNTLKKDYLSPKNWEALRTIKSFLQIFHQATLKYQGHKATLKNILFTMDIIIKHLNKSQVSLSPLSIS